MKFELEKFNRNVSEEDLISDLKSVFSKLQENGEKLSYRSYDKEGKYSSSTISTRFGTWNNALKAAEIELLEEKNISNEDLFRNIEEIWITHGRQPVWRDLSKSPSRYSGSTYTERFGGWRNALENFIAYINEEENSPTDEVADSTDTAKANKTVEVPKKRRTSRNISERMRFRILLRDGFTCQSCGASPLKTRNVELHVDHIIPWSKGGETEEKNLQTKCSRCNLGKGNAFNQ